MPKIYCARRSKAPGATAFFDTLIMHGFVIMLKRCAGAVPLSMPRRQPRQAPGKKPGSQEPGFEYWPRGADTITFQEG
jgi:hypothetical protein